MHAAPRTLKVHDVELFVQEGVEGVRADFQSPKCALKHLISHFVDRLLITIDLKVRLELGVRLCLRVELHLARLLELLERLVFFLSPRELSLRFFEGAFLEEGRFAAFNFRLSFSVFLLELLECLLPLSLLLLEDIQETKTVSVQVLDFLLRLKLFHLFLRRWFVALETLSLLPMLDAPLHSRHRVVRFFFGRPIVARHVALPRLAVLVKR